MIKNFYNRWRAMQFHEVLVNLYSGVARQNSARGENPTAAPLSLNFPIFDPKIAQIWWRDWCRQWLHWTTAASHGRGTKTHLWPFFLVNHTFSWWLVDDLFFWTYLKTQFWRPQAGCDRPPSLRHWTYNVLKLKYLTQNTDITAHPTTIIK